MVAMVASVVWVRVWVRVVGCVRVRVGEDERASVRASQPPPLLPLPTPYYNMLGFTKALLIAAVAAQAVVAAPVQSSSNDSNEFHLIRSLGNNQFREIRRCNKFDLKFYDDPNVKRHCPRLERHVNGAEVCEIHADRTQDELAFHAWAAIDGACYANGGKVYNPRETINGHIVRQPVLLTSSTDDSHLLRCENARTDLIYVWFGLINSFCKSLKPYAGKYTCPIDPNDPQNQTYQQEFKNACASAKGYIA
ncbi:hypothetical protein ACQY0O_004129 [Thecaphora frezii]